MAKVNILDEAAEDFYKVLPEEEVQEGPGFLSNPEEEYDTEHRLPGLSLNGQISLAGDTFRKISNKAARYSGYGKELPFSFKRGVFLNVDPDMNPMQNGNALMEGYRNMPEAMQDSYLLTMMETPITFEHGRNGSWYGITNGNIVVDNAGKRSPDELAGSLNHEGGHSTMSRISRNFPKDKVRPLTKKELRQVTYLFPWYDESVRMGLGKIIANDLNDHYGLELYGDYTTPEGRDALDRRIRDKIYEPMMNKGEYRFRRLGADLANFVNDQAHLYPISYIPIDPNNPHDLNYRTGIQRLADFTYGDKYISAFAPMSTEGAAELFLIMSRPGGAEWVKTNMPNTYNALIDLLHNDFRKPQFVAPKKYTRIK